MRRGGRPPARKCGARTHQSKAPCKRGAGWGTSHPGYGRCKNHGGSLPNGIKAAAAEAAREFAVGMLGAEVDLSPTDAMLLAVKLASGQVAYYRLSLAAEADAPGALIDAYERAVERQARISKMALDAGVNERLVRIAERAAEQIALAAEEALKAMEASPDQRRQFASAFGTSLRRLEEPPVDFEGSAVEVT
jgi:hypothetical protein